MTQIHTKRSEHGTCQDRTASKQRCHQRRFLTRKTSLWQRYAIPISDSHSPVCFHSYLLFRDAWSCLVFTPWSWASRYSIKLMIPFSEKKRSYGQFSTTTGAYRVKQVWSSTFCISGINIGVFPSALIDTIWPACQQTFDLYPRFDTDFEAVQPPAIYFLFLCG